MLNNNNLYNWWKNIDKIILSIISTLFILGLFFSFVSTSFIASDKLETNSYPIIEFPSDNIFNQSIYLSPSGENNLATSPHHRTFDTIDEAVDIIKSYLK